MKEIESVVKKDASLRVRQPLWYRLLFTAYLFVIADITLTRSGDGPSSSSFFCLACGEFWLVDFTLNVLLFVPLVPFLRSFGWSVKKAVLFSIALSIGIEAYQYLLPQLGRHSMVSDILANSGGAVLGAVLPGIWIWFTGGGPLSRRIAVSLLWAAIVWFASYWLMRPSYPSDSDWYAQLAANLGHLDRIPGTVISGSVNENPVPFQLRPDSVHGTTGNLVVEADFSLRAPSNSLAPAVSVFDGNRKEVVIVGVRWSDLVIRERTNSSVIGLRSPIFALDISDHIGSADTLRVRTVSSLRSLCVEVSGLESYCWPRRSSHALWAFSPLVGVEEQGISFFRLVWWICLSGPFLLVVCTLLGKREEPAA